MKFTKVAVLLAVFALATVPMFGQLTATGTSQIKVVRTEWISFSVTTALPTLTIPANSLTSNSDNVVVQTAWNLGPSHSTGVQVCVSAAGALAGTGSNTDTIPVNEIFVTPKTGSPTALGSGTACGVAGAVAYTSYDTTTAAGRKNPTGTSENIPVYVDLGSYANDVAVDTYTGTLNLVAYAN